MNEPRSRRRHGRTIALAALCFMLSAVPGRAAVVVVANRMDAAVALAVQIGEDLPHSLSLSPGESRPIFADRPVSVRLLGPSDQSKFQLAPNCAYYIGPQPQGGGPTLVAIGLGETGSQAWPPVDGRGALPDLPEASAITVKIFVDDDELRLRRVWEPAIRKRIEAASDILEAHGGARLRVVGVGTWDSDDAEADFFASLAEFEREAAAAPAQVAIGFTSQYSVRSGRVHMGGTRGPLHSHILIKERAKNILDTERLELLVHELGHYFGASHSPESDSVMRPLMGEGMQRRVGAQVRFDAVNTLLLSLMGQEIRQRGVRKLADVTPATRRRMGEIYTALEPALPKDNAAGQYLRLLNAATVGPLVEDTRRVLEQIVRVAKLKQRLDDQVHDRPPPGERAEDSTDGPGDRLLEFYVRQAALAALDVRRENGPRAFVLAVGFALDNTGTLQKLPLTSSLAQRLENADERTARIAALGAPTMRGRVDLAQHFFVSAHLVALTGSEAARGAGIVKELLDARGGSGFSFRDMAANRAGIVFAGAVLTGRLSLEDVANKFTVETFLPPVSDLREEMGSEEFLKIYGGMGDERLTGELSRIEGRIMALPVYQAMRAPAATP